MAADRERSFKQAERLLKQGKVQQALTELERIADDSPGDLLVLNRVGDLLVRLKRQTEAIGYYEKIAREFTKSGFFPKAIAIYKKIQKLDPEHVDSLFELGNLYLKQRLNGDARMHLLRAGESYLAANRFTRAREVYERLVEAEPNEPDHRILLADARAAEGDGERAAEELIAVATVQLESGRSDEAEKAFRRAADLADGRSETVAGLAFCLAAQDRHDEAVTLIEESLEQHPALAGSMAVIHEIAGNGDEAAKVIAEATIPEVVEDYIKRLIRHSTARARTQEAWRNVDVVLERWNSSENAIGLLTKLAEAEDGGHLPALDRLYRFHRDDGNRKAAAEVLERQIATARARSIHDKVEELETELRNEFPDAVREKPEAEKPPAARPRKTTSAPASPPPEATATDGAWIKQAEAPAVPLSPEDSEFVEGHMTEAEVLQKYGLVAESLQRLQEVTSRFPGHVGAQEKLAAMIRTQGDRPLLSRVLVQLACARRAAGDASGAREAAREASRKGPLPEDLEAVLMSLSLLDRRDGEGAQVDAKAEPEAVSVPPETVTAPAAPAVADQAGPDEDVEIVLEAAEEVPAAPPAGDVDATKTPPADVLEEIGFYLEQGMGQEALERLDGLRSQGYGGQELDALRDRINAAASTAAGEVEIVDEGGAPSEGMRVVEEAAPARSGSVAEESDAGDTGIRFDEEELEELTVALEAELSTAAKSEPAEEGAEEAPTGEESLEEVFETFKQHVDAEVGRDDHRTHYDLGIAYKEMGLIEDAIKEFEIALAGPDIFREACTMLAICERERGGIGEAVTWFQKAIEVTSDGDTELPGLKYDLAETLLQQGDTTGALDLYRTVEQLNPDYRDVQARISELQSSQGT